MENDFFKAIMSGHDDELYRNCTKCFDYGTAGFRYKAYELKPIVFRMGILAALKSKAEKGATVGLIITASHNPEEDNGVKLCQSSGEMLDQLWEKYATKLVNARTREEFMDILRTIGSTIDYFKYTGNVYLGRDTRISSASLEEAAIFGIETINASYRSFGLVTTPQLHYLVVCRNDSSYGKPTLQGYYDKLSSSFGKLRALKNVDPSSKYDPCVFIDGANGVGALKMKEIMGQLNFLNVQIFNDGSSGKLNYKCGADYVKVEQTFPEGTEIIKGKRYASFDGDADRIVYFYIDESSGFHLLDGDKIAALAAKYFQDIIKKIGLHFSIRVIQTAYANGKSTSYIENTLKIPVACVSTGVKHLHHKAKQYDIGIYFEANGHGTVVFKKETKMKLKGFANDENIPENHKVMVNKLLNVIDLINESVGDAISDCLLVESILYEYDWNIQDWDAIYKDYASRQLKVKVPDRNALCTTNADRKCLHPIGLQDAIDSAVSKYPNSRAFARPSGTEDVVRVYAEAETQVEADSLAQQVGDLVTKFTESV